MLTTDVFWMYVSVMSSVYQSMDLQIALQHAGPNLSMQDQLISYRDTQLNGHRKKVVE